MYDPKIVLFSYIYNLILQNLSLIYNLINIKLHVFS